LAKARGPGGNTVLENGIHSQERKGRKEKAGKGTGKRRKRRRERVRGRGEREGGKGG
jgi:hypothetical protein